MMIATGYMILKDGASLWANNISALFKVSFLSHSRLDGLLLF